MLIPQTKKQFGLIVVEIYRKKKMDLFIPLEVTSIVVEVGGFQQRDYLEIENLEVLDDSDCYVTFVFRGAG